MSVSLREVWTIWKRTGEPKNNGTWIIEFNGKYWNGWSFKKSKLEAMKFKSKKHADEYAEDSFTDDTYENLSYWRL